MATKNLYDRELAGQSVKEGAYTVTRDDTGAVVSRIRDNGASATSTKKTTQANASPTHQAAYQAAQSGDWDQVGTLVNQLGTTNQYGETDMGAANQYLSELADQFKYNPVDYYNQQYDKAYGQGSAAVYDMTGGAIKSQSQLDALVEAAYAAINSPGIGTMSSGGSGGSTAASPYAGTNYHQDAIKYAQQGDWANVLAALNQRDEKTMNTGENYGRSSSDIYQELLAKYGTKKENYNGFQYEARPEYYDDYQVRADAALDKLLNREAFSYNPEDDEAYQQYQETYAREGDRAMRDTLAQVAARTGGMASTYAVSAAQQANQYYMQQLADKVPELRKLAYQMYLDDIDLQVQDLGLLQNASNEAYNRYRDTMADWYADRDFAYGSYRDGIADERYDTEWQYQLDRDALSDQRYDTEWEYQLSRDELADKRYDSEWAYQQSRDQVADSQWQQSFNASQRSSGGGGSDTSYADEVTAVAAYLGISEKEANALKNVGASTYADALKALGIGGNSGGNGGGGNGGGGAATPKITDYQSAVDYLRKNVPSGATGIMTESEWKQRKASYQNTGVGGDEVRLNATYADYLNDFVQYKLETSGR